MREDPLGQAFRHVREGETHVGRQRRIVERLREDGHSTSRAEELLHAFEWSLELQRTNLERMLAERETDAAPPPKGRRRKSPGKDR